MGREGVRIPPLSCTAPLPPLRGFLQLEVLRKGAGQPCLATTPDPCQPPALTPAPLCSPLTLCAVRVLPVLVPSFHPAGMEQQLRVCPGAGGRSQGPLAVFWGAGGRAEPWCSSQLNAAFHSSIPGESNENN